jgi:DNA-binding GntR family transcriptional regulator
MELLLNGNDWPTLRSSTLSDGVYDVLRERIRQGILPPGASIREVEIGRALGVSRTPVREALGRLATEGLLERMPHRGFRVTVPPPRDLFELYPVISVLDGVAARLAVPRLTSADLDRLEALNRELAEAIGRNDIRASIVADQQFHALIAERSGNATLIEVLEDLRHRVLQGEVSSFQRVTEGDGASCRSHRRFLDSARRRDAEASARVLEADRFWTARVLLGDGGNGSKPVQAARPDFVMQRT